MKVRDLTLKPSAHKGKLCYAVEGVCPCRPCYNCHDYGQTYGGVYHPDFACATNCNSGCPSPKPEPQHIPGVPGRGNRCKRCGMRLE